MIESGENLTMDDVLDVIRDFPVIPYNYRLIVTTNTVTPGIDQGFDLSDIQFAESQYVVAVNSRLTDIKPGDKILLDLRKMMVSIVVDDNSNEKVQMLEVDPIEVNGKTYAMINENVIKAIDRR